MKNEYEIRGDITAIFINSPKYGKFESLISTDQLEMVKEFKGSWVLKFKKKSGTFYVFGFIFNLKKNRIVYLHRWITGVDTPFQVDHINHDTLDNTKENLRIVTSAQNNQNKKGAYKNNKTSGIRGVSWHKKSNKWRSQIKVNGQKIHLGTFCNVEEAEKAAVEARKKYMPFSMDA